MIKPIWAAVAGVALLGTAAVGGTLVVGSPGDEEEVLEQRNDAATSDAGLCDPARKPAPDTTVWRWGDVAVEIPDVLRAIGRSEQEGLVPVLEVYPQDDPDHGITINADTGVIGKVEDDDPVSERESELQATASSANICPFDRTTAPWPYSGGQPATDRLTLGNITYLQPDPAAGIQILNGTACASGCRDFLEVRSAHSWMAIDADDGRALESAKVTEADKEAFEAYSVTVQVNTR